MENKVFDIRNNVLIKYLGKEEHVVIPEGVTVIGDGALSDMLLAKSITLPSTLRRIGSRVICPDVWGYNYRLEKVIVPSLDVWLNIEFSDEKANLLVAAKNLYIKDELLTKLVVPGKYRRINDYAFTNCTSLKEVIIEEGVEEIGDGVFANIIGNSSPSNIESISLPQSLTKLGSKGGFYSSFNKGVFRYCKNLKSVVIPPNVKVLTRNLFDGCSSLLDVTLPEGLEEIEEFVFSGCDSLTELHLPKTLKTLSINGLKSLKAIDIPLSVNKIVSITRCPLIEELYIPDNVKHIEEIDLNGLKSIRLPHELEYVKQLKLLNSLASNRPSNDYEIFNKYQGGLYLGNEDNPYMVFVRFIDKTATEAVIHEQTKYMCHDSFYSYKNPYDDVLPLELKVRRIILPKGLIWISDYCFTGCDYLETIDMPDGVIANDDCIRNCRIVKTPFEGLFGKCLEVIIEEDNSKEQYNISFKDDKCAHIEYRNSVTLKDGTIVEQYYNYVNLVCVDYALPDVFKLFDLGYALINKDVKPSDNHLRIKMPNDILREVSFDEEFIGLLRYRYFDFEQRITKKNVKDYDVNKEYVLNQYPDVTLSDIDALLTSAKKEKRYLEVEKLRFLERVLKANAKRDSSEVDDDDLPF